MSVSIRDIQDVAEKHLCSGCGVCAYLEPRHIRMVDDLHHGRRPFVVGERSATSAALAACPGHELDAAARPKGAQAYPELLEGWGPVLELWEGYATDGEVRYLASSGGIASALALHCLEAEHMHGVLHIAARKDVPYLNETVLSRSRAELVGACGSRYAPASPCDRLDLVEQAPAPCVFIGKPCDVAAAAKARKLRTQLEKNLGLTIAVFCAGTPSTQGTLQMLRQMGFANPADVKSVRYRGKGWPGHAEVVGRVEGAEVVQRLTYDESWGQILQKHRQWRCYVCLDHTGEFADIAVGDPWYREIPAGEPGRSLVVVRTERGRALLARARAAGAVSLERVDADLLPASQPNLLQTRGAVWGRALVCSIVGKGAPRYRGMASFTLWRKHLDLRKKLQSVYGTIKRVFSKKLYRRAPVVPWVPRFEPTQGQSVEQVAHSAREGGERC